MTMAPNRRTPIGDPRIATGPLVPASPNRTTSPGGTPTPCPNGLSAFDPAAQSAPATPADAP